MLQFCSGSRIGLLDLEVLIIGLDDDTLVIDVSLGIGVGIPFHLDRSGTRAGAAGTPFAQDKFPVGDVGDNVDITCRRRGGWRAGRVWAFIYAVHAGITAIPDRVGLMILQLDDGVLLPDRKSTRLNSSHANISYA